MLVRREEVAINHLVFFHILVFIATASFLWSVHTNKVPQVVTSRGQVQLVADDSCICVIPEGVAHRPKLAVETHLHPPLAAAAPSPQPHFASLARESVGSKRLAEHPSIVPVPALLGGCTAIRVVYHALAFTKECILSGNCTCGVNTGEYVIYLTKQSHAAT